MIIRNARIYTQNPERPVAQALATMGDRIVCVGGNEETESFAGHDRTILDLGGKAVLPGFIDCHVHFLWGGLSLMRPDLRGVRSSKELLGALRNAAQRRQAGEWIVCENLDPHEWDDDVAPTRTLIDAAVHHIPIFIRQTDGHSALVNGTALELASIDKSTPDPPGGRILRDPGTEEPTGILRDAAISLVSHLIPAPGEKQKLEALRCSHMQAARHGVTSVHDMASLDDLDLYPKALGAGSLRTRLCVYCHETAPEEELEEIADQSGTAPWISRGGLKVLMDGSLGSRTALFTDPYTDEPDHCGSYDGMAIPLGPFENALLAADRMGLQLAVHAIGDRAVHELLDMLERIADRNGPRDRRFRVEHAQHLLPRDFARFARLGVIASVQPSHVADDGRWAEKAIGKERCGRAFAFRSFLDAGARLAFGSDWPVAVLDPLVTIRSAVTRRTNDGKDPGGWFPEQRLNIHEAVKAHTIDAAYAEFADNEKGSLQPGKLADLVVLSHDIIADPDTLDVAKVVMTMVGGEIVHNIGE